MQHPYSVHPGTGVLIQLLLLYHTCISGESIYLSGNNSVMMQIICFFLLNYLKYNQIMVLLYQISIIHAYTGCMQIIEMKGGLLIPGLLNKNQ